MNPGQERFFNFIIEKVDVDSQNKAKELLSESFLKQDNGTFNKEYMMSFIPRMLALIKPEFVEEVKIIMTNHKA